MLKWECTSKTEAIARINATENQNSMGVITWNGVYILAATPAPYIVFVYLTCICTHCWLLLQ